MICQKRDLVGTDYVTDDDLSFEWNILKEATKKTNVSITAARDFTILRKLQKDLGIQ